VILVGAEVLAFLLLLIGWAAVQVFLARKLGLVRLAETTLVTDPRHPPSRFQRVASNLFGVMLLSVPLHAIAIMLLVIAAALR
jgi:hypothetical protein